MHSNKNEDKAREHIQFRAELKRVVCPKIHLNVRRHLVKTLSDFTEDQSSDRCLTREQDNSPPPVSVKSLKPHRNARPTL